MTFVQVIEYETSRTQEMDQLFDEWMRATEGNRPLTHELHNQGSRQPAHFVDIVEFPPYEQAMRNNALPETGSMAQRMRSLCSNDPRFVNLEVARDEAA